MPMPKGMETAAFAKRRQRNRKARALSKASKRKNRGG